MTVLQLSGRSRPMDLRRAVLVIGLVMCPLLAQAQRRDTVLVRDWLPPDVAQEVVALFNATLTLRATDRLEIEAGRVVPGDVAVLNGPVVIAGHVRGRVLAINADVLLAQGARIDGDLLVVGGEIDGVDSARVGGEIRVHRHPLRYTLEGNRLVARLDGPQHVEQWWRRLERAGRDNFNRLEVANAGVYNRVEGLPVRVGPVLYRDQGWGHLRLDATAVARTASSFTSQTADVGHDVRGEIRIGRRFGASVGGRLFDIVDGVEQWQLSNVEVGLSSFLFHRDYRDYYGRHGGQLFAALRATNDADFTISFSDERWRARDARNPFSFALNDVDWRDNPVMDAGRFHVANVTLRIDTRNDDFNPWAGWYLLADFERGAGRIESAGPTSPGLRELGAGATRYGRAFVDLRRYGRLAPGSALNLRGVLGGWLSGDPLPLQRRLSIDGPGTVPGFDFRSMGGTDVGTCTVGTPVAGHPAQCERIALGQIEYRNDVRLSFTDTRHGERRNRFRADGAWVLFADAGRGWLVNAPDSPLNFRRNELPSLGSYRTDIGVGIDFDQMGLYVAKALSEPTERMKFFARVRHRF